MSTVTYKNQPAIHQTRGAIPLAGTAYLYTVTKLLWPREVEAFLATILIPPTLHICCGMSKLGDIRLDLYAENVDVKADAARLPFPNDSFATVLIDPPYNSKLQWMHDMLSELSRVANTRIIFQHWFSPVDKAGRYRKKHAFTLTALYNWMPKTYFGRMQIISVFDHIETPDEYFNTPGCTCRPVRVPGSIMIGGQDDCPVHGFG